MEFKALYFDDKLLKVNPEGVIGVVTLWSKPDYVMERFREAGVDLDPATSPIAVFGTLYGNGLRELLRNLLYNPQIQVLLICGHDRSGSANELSRFFDFGLEPVKSQLVEYQSLPDFEKISTSRISNTNRLIDDLVKPESFKKAPRIVPLGDPRELTLIQGFFKDFQLTSKDLAEKELERKNIPLPELEVQFLPSNPRAFQIIKDAPLEAWKELLFFISRFGRRVSLKKGDRLELQNVKVVVEDPKFENRDKLLRMNIDPERLRRYQDDIIRVEYWLDGTTLDGQMTLPLFGDEFKVDKREDESYSYSHRLRQYFGVDGLTACVKRLQKDIEDRKAYFALWDSNEDLQREKGHPCFVSLFFRKFEDKLTVTATFRTHNALDGWLLNFYGLMAIQKWVAERVGLQSGAITIVSHSISIDPRELDRALMVVSKRKWKMHLDPMGYFRVTIDGNEILVEHRFEDVTLKAYRGRTAVSLQHQIARDVAISDINHAMYLGRQLAKAEMALKDGREFVQD
jgi:thymidylate synthase